MDQNEALSGQGAEENPQGDQTSSNNNAQSMESLLETESLGVDLPQPGEIRTGTIASIVPGQILVSIGAKSEGVISGRELEQLSGEEREAFKVGAQIPVYVVNPEDANGNVVLSFRRAQEQISWENVEKMLEEDRVYESKIIGFNKGGLIVPVGGLRGFLPASQISAVRRSQSTGDTPEQRWQKMVGEPISVRIIEVDRERRRLILSERAATSESRQSIKERVINELVEDQVYTGRVTSLADFGAFVNINGADGLVHLSELSWDRVQHPSEVLEVGQEVKVKVISIDREKKRIGLSIRALADDPWKARIEKFSVGQLVEGVITRLTKFGAFARLEGDIEGLIHISEISEHRIEHPKEVLKEGEVVALRVIRIDPDQHRIGLSLRKVDSAAYADKDFKMLTQELEHAEPEEPAPLSEAGDKAEELGRSGPEESPSPSETGDKAEELGHSGPEESPSPSETGGEAKESGTTKPEESPPPPEAGGEDVPASSPQGEG